jgi:hypothetical protein
MITASEAASTARKIAVDLYTKYVDQKIREAIAKGLRNVSIACPFYGYLHHFEPPLGQIALWANLTEARSGLHALGYVTEIKRYGEGRIELLVISW